MADTSDTHRALRCQGKLAGKLKGANPTTRDVDSSGIFFETDRSFSPGQPVRLTIALEYGHADGPIRMTCQGEVAGVEQVGDKMVIVSTIDSYSFGELRPQREIARK